MFGNRTIWMRVCCALVSALAVPAAAFAADTVKKSPNAKAAPAAASAKAAPAAAPTTQPTAAQDAAAKAQMEAMLKLATPGPEHAWLKSMEGTWKATTKSWEAPGDPQVSEGTSENHLVLGGRWLQSHYVGSMMGQPYEGWGLIGYDNGKKQYVATWADNFSTAMMVATGTGNGKEMETKATMDGPDGTPMNFRMVTAVVDAKTHTFTMYVPAQGTEQKMMEITYTRQ